MSGPVLLRAGLAVLLALLALALPARAQLQRPITALGLREGLPQGQVSTMDRRGHLWAGTYSGGLARYDGTAFSVFGRTEGLAGPHVRALLETRAGPLDASMWSPHRLVTAPGTHDPFALDVSTPSWWPFAFRTAGFSPVSYYVSTEHPLDAPSDVLPVDGLTLRALTPSPGELRRLHPLLEAQFASRPGFVPLTPALFTSLVQPYKALVVDDLALLVEAPDGTFVGFAFGLPDPDGETLVVRVLAADAAYEGLDCWLLGTLARNAHARGLRRVVHALLPEASARHLCRATPGVVRRRYALLARKLTS